MTELGVLEVWLPSEVVNPLNRREHWTADAGRARRQRDAVCLAVHAALGRAYRLAASPARPKRITFHAYTARTLDLDGLTAALKHVRDGLVDAGIIHGDAPIHGHEFRYDQTAPVPRRHRGVRVTVTLRDTHGG